VIEIDRPVHPAAAVFPMLPEDELAELAEDIETNGLRHPIVLDSSGRIIDGRNRYAACLVAGVEPTFITFDGDEREIGAYILSMNEKRRHSTEGQRAIAVVRVLGPYNLYGTRGAQDAAAETNGIVRPRISQALVIVEHAPELADAVMAKTMPFSKAYEDARAIRDAKQNRERTAEGERLSLERIRDADSDLHLMVTEGRLTVADAVAVLDRRLREEREARERESHAFGNATAMVWSILSMEGGPSRLARRWLPAANTSAGIGGCEYLWTADGLRRLAARLVEAADAWPDASREGEHATP
jgi:hypothetical protein